MDMRLMTAVRVGTSVVSGVLIGLWVNLFTDQLSENGYLTASIGLGWGNFPLFLGIASLAVGEGFVRRQRMLERDDFVQRYELLRQRQRRILESTLRIMCELVSRTLEVTCNARYFVAERDEDGRHYLRQDRDLAVLNISMPREYGFTRIYVDTPHIVSGQAYRERVPLYQELPVDHSNLYDPDVSRMIEPRQRWVLACPVLRLDAATNSHVHGRTPHGVIVFYGTEVPSGPDVADRVRGSLDYTQQFAEQMSHILNMLELSTASEMAGEGDTAGAA
ncbi:hypothetical protein IQ279_05905 [Streptomyces verrucosisporus]|uniref:hypothetical protein n=1 Tax=Streptomyces verrucosisporus TaxID=1695161 RepID=UPI0019D25113|nr:hypothetical protein [Streptomyces verrucosisporus]MBN3929178.1 hypothetical protein [Streptomyces verrucosisporus]